ATYGLHFNPSDGRVKFTLGGAYNEYLGKHFGEVIWARFASDSDLGDKYYEDDAVKKDFNIFAKATYSLEHWAFFADLQYRWISYAFLGYDRNLTQLDQTAYLNFFNPKIGVTYAINPLHQLYGSLSI